MGKINIEWVRMTQPGAHVVPLDHHNTLDIMPPDFTDASFEVITTSTTVAVSGAAPAESTHVMATSVSGVHYARVNATPATGTGGVCITDGATRVFDVLPADTISFVTSS